MDPVYTRLDYPGQCVDIRHFQPFNSDEESSKGDTHIKTLIVSRELALPILFSSVVHLYRMLRVANIDVDVLLLQDNETELNQQLLGLQGVDLNVKDFFSLVRKNKIIKSPLSKLLEDSFHLDEFLTSKNNQYTSVITLDSFSDLYYPLLTRDAGLGHLKTNFFIYKSHSSYFEKVIRAEPVTSAVELNLFHIERKAITLADAYISNSEHYLNWTLENENIDELKNIYYQDVYVDKQLIAKHTSNRAFRSKDSFVFVMGNACSVELNFCIEALKRIESTSLNIDLIVSKSEAKKNKRLLKLVAKNVNIVTSAIDDIDWLYLSENARAIILPNPTRVNDVVLSILRSGETHILADEIIKLPDSNGLLQNKIPTFVHNPEVIKNYLLNLIDKKQKGYSLDNKQSWFDLMLSLPKRYIESAAPTDVKITVCIAHYNRGDLLMRAFDSVINQSYPCYEVIIVDDGSTEPKALSTLSKLESTNFSIDVRVIRQNNLFIGASRNKGIAAAKGDYILFMDDDNEAKPGELEVFKNAVIATSADIYTCLSEVFSGTEPKKSNIPLQTTLFAGPNIGSGILTNPFGDSNMLVRATSAKKIGGFSEAYKVGRDDHEFILRALLNGLSIKLIPKPLYFYRINKNKIRKTHLNTYSGFARVLQTYSQHSDVGSTQMISLAQGMNYVVGPWGVNQKVAVNRVRLIEFMRIYIAKFPFLYTVFESLKRF